MRGLGTTWLVLLAVGATPAAADWKLTTRSTVADPGALPAACAASGATSFAQLAVDQEDPRRLTTVWTSDGIRGVGASVSTDRGRTWRSEPVPGATACTGGPAARKLVVNPRIAGGLGRTWFGSSWISEDAEPTFDWGTLAHVRTADGWRDGSPVVPGRSQNVGTAPDLADPDRAVALTVSFTAVPVPPFIAYAPVDSPLRATRTTDGGRTWAPPVAVHPPTPDRYDVEVQAVRQSDGSVLAVWSSIPKQGLAEAIAGRPVVFDLRSARSTDEGRTWSPPVQVGLLPFADVPDPDGGPAAGGNVKFDLAAGPGGRALLAWGDGTALVHARSLDAGVTWGAPQRLVREAPIHSVDAAIDGAGTEALFFYDLSADQPGDASLDTTAQLAVLGDTPQVVALAPPFDSRRARVAGLPYDGNLPLGVTQSVEGLPRGFAAAFAVAPPLTTSPTTVRFAAVELRRPRARRSSTRRPARRPGRRPAAAAGSRAARPGR